MGEQETNFYEAVLIVVLLIAIIIVYFIITIIRYHRRYIKLQKERILAEITIQENERKRIATDLHDGLGPLLSSVKLNINSIEVPLESDRLIVEKAGRHIDEIIKSMRQISYNLLPNTLARKGLIEALKEFTSLLNEKNHMTIELQVLNQLQIDKEREIHIFRMIQEIIHNALKHSNANTLKIGIGQEDGFLMILVRDDGKGFDLEKAKDESKGLGLKSLESRTEILNGQLVIDSKPGQGTEHFIKIPDKTN
ncbi:MAG: sensor histidine kinase [Gemmatimonadaceae bacterium]|nr:sensor histidine kinase [Chitinophagaceae bacterium]